MGIYMDNAGLGSGTTTPAFVNAGNYIDWWVTTASSATNAFTYSMHFVVFPNDPGVHTYFVANHSATDIAGSIGQVQWVYRSNLNDFTNTYTVNGDLSNPGPVIVPLPANNQMFSSDPGRAVQDATVDLHGFTLPAGYTRQFYTKYDYSSYNYLHQAHGTFGNTFGTWAYFPSNESLVGGPTKQNLIYTGNLLILEAYSNHLDNQLSLTTPAGTASSRLFGPFYIHFNTFGQAYNTTGNTLNTPDDMYADTLQAGASFVPLYDTETQLLQNGYVPSTARGTVSVQVNGVTGAPKTAWAVLSDPGKNIEYSSKGAQYWADVSNNGSATFTGVIPGTYRLSVYNLGKWGELRKDGIVVSANQTTTVPAVTFVPENFGVETVFTIGTADRSSHEFLHGHDAQGHDDREFWGAWNYWADFAANGGAVFYNATTGPNGTATNDLSKWNYNHWGFFDPGLYGGVYNSADDTTDGYIYAIPSYVAALSNHTGTNGVTTRLPVWQVHFASPADVTNYQYAVLSVSLACSEGSYVLNLNGTARTWSFTNASDCAVRSGLSGYTQWIAFQFPISSLKAAGADNLLTIGVSQTQGDMDDAIRLELTNTSAAPATTGWNDYEYVPTSSTSNNIRANDAVPNP
jgi:rhamnogalacturonan endolyase